MLTVDVHIKKRRMNLKFALSVVCANNGTMPSVSLYACPKQRKSIFVSNVYDDCNYILSRKKIKIICNVM